MQHGHFPRLVTVQPSRPGWFGSGSSAGLLVTLALAPLGIQGGRGGGRCRWRGGRRGATTTTVGVPLADSGVRVDQFLAMVGGIALAPAVVDVRDLGPAPAPVAATAASSADSSSRGGGGGGGGLSGTGGGNGCGGRGGRGGRGRAADNLEVSAVPELLRSGAGQAAAAAAVAGLPVPLHDAVGAGEGVRQLDLDRVGVGPGVAVRWVSAAKGNLGARAREGDIR